MVSQLRIFTIAAWLKGVYPLRLQLGFTIDAAWVLDSSNKFAWVLSYDGPEGFEARDAAYYASTDRQQVHPDPRQYITSVEAHFLTDVVPCS